MYAKSARFYDALYSFKDYAAEADQVHELIQTRYPGARTLLDVACGTGAHLAHLAKNYEVAGLDLTEELLDVARERMPQERLLVGDMRSFDLDETFDAITCLFSAIGYVIELDELHQTAERFAQHLNPGGVVLVEPWLHPELWQEGHIGTLIVDEPDLKIARYNVSHKEGVLTPLTMHHMVATPAGVEHFEEEHVLRLYTHDEYVEAFARAGLEVEHDSKGLMGRGFYIGTKPAPAGV